MFCSWLARSWPIASEVASVQSSGHPEPGPGAPWWGVQGATPLARRRPGRREMSRRSEYPNADTVSHAPTPTRRGRGTSGESSDAGSTKRTSVVYHGSSWSASGGKGVRPSDPSGRGTLGLRWQSCAGKNAIRADRGLQLLRKIDRSSQFHDSEISSPQAGRLLFPESDRPAQTAGHALDLQLLCSSPIS